jgi:diguanylate cyclase (GGDEF)-like protein
VRPEPVDVCIIEDDADQRALLFRRMLDQHFSAITAEDAEAGLTQVRHHRPRVVVCDMMLPGMSATELCRQVRADPTLDTTYFVVITGCADRDVKNTALNTGVDNYLVKPYDAEELIAQVRNGLRISHLQERLRRAALTDGLTGLWNHAQFRDLLEREFARTNRYGGGVAMLMLDLDHFKAVNDTYGHETGNLVLQGTACHLLRMVRDTDIVARYGGEEFAVVCPETSLNDAMQLAERIGRTLADTVRVAHHPQLTVTASIGVCATSDARVLAVGDLIDLADQALYLAKRRGRNSVACSDDIGALGTTVELEQEDVGRLRKQIVSLNMQAKELCLQSVWALVQALEARDRFSAWHSRNTTFYVTGLAEAANLPAPLRSAVANAAMLHDLGKIGVPDRVLQSTAALTEEQAAVVRQVPLVTCRILEPLRVFETEIAIIRYLREHFDGTGYPLGLSGAAIPIGSRLLAVAECFEALTSERPHRHAVDMATAAELIGNEAGRHFDPQFTELLKQVLRTQGKAWLNRIRRSRTELARMSRAATAGVG